MFSSLVEQLTRTDGSCAVKMCKLFVMLCFLCLLLSGNEVALPLIWFTYVVATEHPDQIGNLHRWCGKRQESNGDVSQSKKHLWHMLSNNTTQRVSKLTGKMKINSFLAKKLLLRINGCEIGNRVCTVIHLGWLYYAIQPFDSTVN